jgi:hypothetical protein
VRDPFLALLSPPTDDPDYEVMARDESYEDEVRVRAALNARAIREELRPQ